MNGIHELLLLHIFQLLPLAKVVLVAVQLLEIENDTVLGQREIALVLLSMIFVGLLTDFFRLDEITTAQGHVGVEVLSAKCERRFQTSFGVLGGHELNEGTTARMLRYAIDHETTRCDTPFFVRRQNVSEFFFGGVEWNVADEQGALLTNITTAFVRSWLWLEENTRNGRPRGARVRLLEISSASMGSSSGSSSSSGCDSSSSSSSSSIRSG